MIMNRPDDGDPGENQNEESTVRAENGDGELQARDAIEGESNLVEDFTIMQNELVKSQRELVLRVKRLERVKEGLRVRNQALADQVDDLMKTFPTGNGNGKGDGKDPGTGRDSRLDPGEQKLVALGHMIGNIGHELRNPLNVISNAVFFVKRKIPDTDDVMQKYLNILGEEVLRANRIISQLLDYARIKRPVKETTSLPVLVRKVMNRIPIPARITINVKKMDEEGDNLILVDPFQFEMVLQNLVTNAIEAIETGEGSITIGLSRQEGQHCITITDTGKGIQGENVKKLFTPLFTTKQGGTGFGLSIIKDIVEAHGGSINVETEPGEGTTFILLLPMASRPS
ncbi:GHKL domain-containing protein [Candidatus Bathyarchaeota archaeon]|nr:GHKL domain-containing protein [Candidatus Bathyarchaeota archaeon]